MHRLGSACLGLAGLALAGLGLASGVAPALGAPVPWGQDPLTYTVVDQELRDLLVEIGTRLGTRVRVSEAVRARVRGRLPPAPPREFLERLAAIYGFEWFYDGGTLWVSTPAESQTKLLQLGPVGLPQLGAAMEELGVADERWPLRGSGQAGVVVVNGPPRFVAMTEQTLSALQQRNRPQNSDVRVFRGQSSGPS